MLQLEDLQLMRHLASTPSLSGAARSMHVTTPALSMRLKRLEAQLGVSLALRSTRRLALTREGQQLAEQAALIMAQMEAIPESLAQPSGELTGSLRITAPFGFGRSHVAKALAQFAQHHPRIEATLELLETPWPDQRDADVVIHIGAVRDSSWIAHPLAHNERWLCASPAYLREHGSPSHPRELANHSTLCIRENNADGTLWHYQRSKHKEKQNGKTSGERASVRVLPQLLSNDGEITRNWALAGLGIVLRSQWDVQSFVENGQLVRLLPQWHFDGADILALVPTRRHQSARVQAWLSHLKQCIESNALKSSRLKSRKLSNA
jgi:DNA-binding transcriptional LysR family regulator